MVRFSHSSIPGEYRDIEVGTPLKGLRFSNGKRPDTVEVLTTTNTLEDLNKWWCTYVFHALEGGDIEIINNAKKAFGIVDG